MYSLSLYENSIFFSRISRLVKVWKPGAVRRPIIYIWHYSAECYACINTRRGNNIARVRQVLYYNAGVFCIHCNSLLFACYSELLFNTLVCTYPLAYKAFVNLKELFLTFYFLFLCKKFLLGSYSDKPTIFQHI